MKITQDQLIQQMKQELERVGVRLTKLQLREVLRAQAKVALDELAEGREVPLPDIGTLKRTYRTPRTGRNPKTGEAVQIAGRYSARLSLGKDFKDALVMSKQAE